MYISRILRSGFVAAFGLSFSSIIQGGEPANDWAIPARQEDFHVFLLLGQSNMSGCGELVRGDKEPVPGIVAIPTVMEKEAEPAWVPAAHPLHNRLDSDGFGLGIPFAEEYQRLSPGVTVGLIPLGWGGAPIKDLEKGTPNYELAISRVRWASRQGVIRGVLWHQGESDTVEAETADLYAKRLDQLIADLRADLGQPELPFVAGNLAEFYGTGPDHNAPQRVAQIKQVCAALRELPGRVPHTAFVESTGLKSVDEHMVHFDRASFITFGQRFARKLDRQILRPGSLRKATAIAELAVENRELVQDDWLIRSSDRKAEVYRSSDNKEIVLSNGLIRRAWRIAPNAACVAFDNLMNDQSLLRAVRPEAILELEGVKCPIGGLVGQRDHAYLLPLWPDTMHADPQAFEFAGFEVGETRAPFAWKRVRYSEGRPWPARGASLTLHFRPSPKLITDSGIPSINKLSVSIHYEMYDGIPLVCKWLEVENEGDKAVRLNRFTSEILAAVEYESVADRRERWEYPNIHVESDYEFRGMDPTTANKCVHWVVDPQFRTQVSASDQTPCLLEVRPPLGPDVDIAPGESFESFRTFELVHDSTERERRGLAVRRMYRTVAPWSTENPIMMHVASAQPEAVKLAVDQAAEVGFEMVILTFWSGVNLENEDPKYLAELRSLVEYANAKGIELGAYSLLASRSEGREHDVVNPSDVQQVERRKYGSPCIESRWGQDYFRKLYAVYEKTGLNLLEHDGSYPGEVCCSTEHPGHRGLDDSQWNQWTRIRNFYRWCRGRGVYLNVPDFYYLNGSNKCGMGYRESNWQLPRAQQILHTRQNIFDGTWQKTPSMGWMFVPLTEYGGGGGEATIEPLRDHLDDYEAMMANLFTSGVQACYRGPRLYDSEKTKELVKHYVDFYKRHRAILDSDLIHVRRADGRDLDCLLHVNPQLPQRGFAVIFNPTDRTIAKTIKLPLYYTGLEQTARISREQEPPRDYPLARRGDVEISLEIRPKCHTWFSIEAPTTSQQSTVSSAAIQP